MLIEASDLPDGALVESDVCIVGGGPAGISVALELIGSGLEVCLLEAGGRLFDERLQELYRGETDGAPEASYLETSRLRCFGGTSNHWGGDCFPLAEVDLEPRPWIPDSGWPFPRATLEPYYRRAAALCQVEGAYPTEAPAEGAVSPSIAAGTFYRSPPTRFGIAYAPRLEAAPGVRVVLGAAVTRVGLAPPGNAVAQLDAVTLQGRRLTARARAFVLALGGLEVPRLLLLSNDVHPAGVGNGHDLVGRYFMDHPLFPVAAVCRAEEGALVPRGSERVGFRLRLSDPVRAEEGLRDCLLGMEELGEIDDRRRSQVAAASWNAVAAGLDAVPGGRPRRSLRAALFSGEPPPRLWLTGFNLRPEQAPNRESRVTLSPSSRDSLGQPRLRLRWQVTDQDIASARRSAELIALELGRRGLGRMSVAPLEQWREVMKPGYHHMGATRMHRDPSRGVVDPHCQVHGVANLYIASSSVFPTAGAANPTFTIVALAARLADRLREVVGRS